MPKEKAAAGLGQKPAQPDAEFPESTSLYGQGYRQGLSVGHAEGRAEGVIEGRRQKVADAPFFGVLLVGAVCGALAMWIVYGIARALAAWLS